LHPGKAARVDPVERSAASLELLFYNLDSTRSETGKRNDERKRKEKQTKKKKIRGSCSISFNGRRESARMADE
jgi:hypothetical protein